MAISLAHTLQEAKRRSQVSSIGYHDSQPGSEYFSNSDRSAPPTYVPPHNSTDHKQPQNNSYTALEQDYIPPPPPPRPHRSLSEQVPNERPPLYQAPTISIEPDPLPPHSNPQALTQTQSIAFQNSSPVAPVRLSCNALHDSQTGLPFFVLKREAAHAPAFLSSKPIVNIIRTSTDQLVGQVQFHTFTTSAIDLHINGKSTSLSHSGFMHDRWSFSPTSMYQEGKQMMWFWSKDKVTGGARLEDSKKHGNLLARMKGDTLTFEAARLTRESYEEVLVSAVAMVEAARRQRKGADIVDLASAVGELAEKGGGDLRGRR